MINDTNWPCHQIAPLNHRYNRLRFKLEIIVNAVDAHARIYGKKYTAYVY